MNRDAPADLEGHGQPAKPEPGIADSENRLDALLAQAAHVAHPAASAEVVKVDPLVRLREIFATQLECVIADLRTKYGPIGVTVTMDAAKFLAGGRTLALIIEYNGQGTRLDGTVMNSSIAFQQTRYLQKERSGITGSGPTLRTRDLNAEIFRAFVCERIATLVRSTLRHPV